MNLLVLYLGLALIVSFLCSLLEASFLSLSHAHVAVLKKQQRKVGFLLETMKREIDRPLAAILTLNTIANTVGAAGVGAQVLRVYGESYVAIASGSLTFSILILSEIIPKTLGASYARQLAPFTAYTIRLLIALLYPFVVISEKITELFDTSGAQKKRMTREEVIVSAEMGEVEGTLLKNETAVIKNLLRLRNIFVRDVMTPRSVMVALNAKTTVKDVMDRYAPVPFSRIPIFKDSLDEITGLVLRYQILEKSAHDEDDIRLEELEQPVRTVPESQSIGVTLDEFIKRREHLFVVTDDYGMVTGLITLEDCIETLLGVEIVDEFDSVEDMRQFALEEWEKRRQQRLAAAGKKALIG